LRGHSREKSQLSKPSAAGMSQLTLRTRPTYSEPPHCRKEPAWRCCSTLQRQAGHRLGKTPGHRQFRPRDSFAGNTAGTYRIVSSQTTKRLSSCLSPHVDTTREPRRQHASEELAQPAVGRRFIGRTFGAHPSRPRAALLTTAESLKWLAEPQR